jgi:type 2 lantibiotic biosynthesis protein LanM
LIPNLSLFSGRLFCARGQQATLDAPEIRSAEISEICKEAETSLRSVCREGCDVLSQSAWKDLRDGFSKFLDHLLLLNPDGEYLQCIVRTWVEAQHEMLSRLRSDREALGVWLLSACGPVVAVETDLSDRHDGGRTVTVFTFESSLRVVYKPREMGIEGWYCRFAGWLNDSGTPFPIRAARVMIRPGYGWMEFVPHARCVSKEELGRYYRNAGALLCLLHVLRARDCHFQNLIACGQDPVLVDAEMLFQAQLAEGESTSVTQTGMIPNFRFGPEGQHYDVSGLGFVERKATHFRVPEWSATGVRYAMGVLEPRQNIPLMADQAARPQDYVSEMVDGFTQTYRFLADHRNDVLAWIRTAAALPVRYLIRETMEYYEALQFDLSREIEGAVILPALASARMIFSDLRQEENASLERLDIPRFILAAEERSLCGLESCFYRSGLELALSGIEELSEKDLAKQIQHIHLSWSLSQISASLA